jgi:hypothetical protein
MSWLSCDPVGDSWELLEEIGRSEEVSAVCF